MGIITDAVIQIESAYTGLDDMARGKILEAIGGAIKTLTGSQASDDEQVQWFMKEAKEALAPFKDLGIGAVAASIGEVMRIKTIIREHAPIIASDVLTFLNVDESHG